MEYFAEDIANDKPRSTNLKTVWYHYIQDCNDSQDSAEDQEDDDD